MKAPSHKTEGVASMDFEHVPLMLPHCRQVLGIYKGRSWRSIEEHINDVLGRQQRELADASAAMGGRGAAGAAGGGGGAGMAATALDDSTLRAMGHFMALLDCGSRPTTTQQHYLDQFVELAKKVQTKQVIMKGNRGEVGCRSALSISPLPIY